MRCSILLAFALGSSLILAAQDSLFHINGLVVLGAVEEIGVSTVRYRARSADHDVLVTVERVELARVKLANGQDFVWVPMSLDPKGQAMVRTRNHIAIDLIAPSLNHMTFGYQRTLADRLSLSVKAGYIGLYTNAGRIGSVSQARNGGLIKLGVNLRLPASAKRPSTLQHLHPLMGWYIRPEIVVSAWQQRSVSYSISQYYESDPITFSNGAFLFNVGGQWLLSNRITFGLYGALGYGFQYIEGKPVDAGYRFADENYAFSHAHISRNSPLVASGGMMVGCLF